MTTAMRAGQLRHRVELQRRKEGTDDFGEPTDEWETYATVWAAVRPLQGRDRWAAQQVNAEVTHEVEIRHRSDVKAEHRIKHGDRVLRIEAPFDPDERGARLMMPCSEEVE